MLKADRKERLTSLAGVLVLHLLLGWALLISLAPTFVRSVSESLDVFTVREVPPPPPVEPEPEPLPQHESKAPSRARPQAAEIRPAGEAAAPRPRAEMARVPQARPEREVRPPVAAGLVPATGGETSPLGSNSSGAGTGSGGSGSGTGSNGSGSGTGGGGTGGGGGVAASAQLRSGRITPSDYPRAANGQQGEVTARLAVSAAGAVTGCRIMQSSGNAVLDATTCRLIRERFRFNPARDAEGNAVPDVRGWRQRWWRD